MHRDNLYVLYVLQDWEDSDMEQEVKDTPDGDSDDEAAKEDSDNGVEMDEDADMHSDDEDSD